MYLILLPSLVGLFLSLMRIEFEKSKEIFPTDWPILVKQGQVRGNKNFFRLASLKYFVCMTLPVRSQKHWNKEILLNLKGSQLQKNYKM